MTTNDNKEFHKLMRENFKNNKSQSEYDIVVDGQLLQKTYIGNFNGNVPSSVKVFNYKLKKAKNILEPKEKESVFISVKRAITSEEVDTILSMSDSDSVSSVFNKAKSLYSNILDKHQFIVKVLGDYNKYKDIIPDLVFDNSIRMPKDEFKLEYRKLTELYLNSAYIVDMSFAKIQYRSDDTKSLYESLKKYFLYSKSDGSQVNLYEQLESFESSFDDTLLPSTRTESLYLSLFNLFNNKDFNTVRGSDVYSVISSNPLVAHLYEYMLTSYYIDNEVDIVNLSEESKDNLRGKVSTAYYKIFDTTVKSAIKKFNKLFNVIDNEYRDTIDEYLSEVAFDIKNEFSNYINATPNNTITEVAIDSMSSLTGLFTTILVRELVMNILVGYKLYEKVMENKVKLSKTLEELIPNVDTLYKMMDKVTESKALVSDFKNKLKSKGCSVATSEPEYYINDKLLSTKIFGIELGTQVKDYKPIVEINENYRIVFITTPAFRSYLKLKYDFDIKRASSEVYEFPIVTSDGESNLITDKDFTETYTEFYNTVIDNYTSVYTHYISSIVNKKSGELDSFMNWSKDAYLPLMLDIDGLYNPYTSEPLLYSILISSSFRPYLECSNLYSVYKVNINKSSIRYIPINEFFRTLNIGEYKKFDRKIVPYLLGNAVYKCLITNSILPISAGSLYDFSVPFKMFVPVGETSAINGLKDLIIRGVDGTPYMFGLGIYSTEFKYNKILSDTTSEAYLDNYTISDINPGVLFNIISKRRNTNNLDIVDHTKNGLISAFKNIGFSSVLKSDGGNRNENR